MRNLIAALALTLGACSTTTNVPIYEDPCGVGGVWKLIDSRATDDGGLCASPNLMNATSALTITVGPGYTISEDGQAYDAVHLDTASCTVTGSYTQSGADDGGVPVTISATRILTFHASQEIITGTSTINAGITGTPPCGLAFTTTGTKN